jgi:putative two-component system response regulator
VDILIVDDDIHDVELTRRWLERGGHAVRHADSGPAALEILSADPLPDLVILDVMLPKIDGFALLRRLRAEERTRQLPIVIASGFDRHQDAARGMELGANDYFVKPLMEYQFLGRIAKHLRCEPADARVGEAEIP